MAIDFTTTYAAIIKSEKQDDGTLLVYGKATDDSIDSDEQICDMTWLEKAMPEWFKSGGNIREQHSNIAAGVAKELDSKADGFYINALVVDAQSVKKVETGVLKGFSIGIRAPRVVRDNKAVNGRIIDGQIVEVSLVDRPANPNAKLMLAKSDGGEVVQVEELVEQELPATEVTETEPNNTEAVVETPAENSEVSEQNSEVSEEIATDEVEKSDSKCADCGCHIEAVKSDAPADVELAVAPDAGCDCKCDKCAGGKGCDSEICKCSTVKSTITPLPTIERVGDVADEEIFESEDDSNKSALSDSTIDAIIEKAVKSAKESVLEELTLIKSAKEAVENKVAELETELVAAKALAANGGPKRTGAPKVTADKALSMAAIYRAKAAATTDKLLSKGYKEMADDFAAKALTPTE